MKKTIILVIAVSLIIAGVAMATVVSSKHDMRNYVVAGSGRTIVAVGSATTQVCVFCHHPHRGTDANAGSVLLWNINDATRSYATYSSPTTNSTGISNNDIVDTTAAASKYTLLCMGCHDGANSANSFIRTAADGTLGAVPVFGALASNLESTLTDDHPVDFTYPTTTGAGIVDIQMPSGDQVLSATGNITYPLFTGTMQCATCHNVHNGSSSNVQFMRGNNIIKNSKICTDCHTAK